MKTIKIGIDIDNTVCETFPKYLERYNRHFGRSLKFEEIKTQYFIGTNDGLTKVQSESFINILLHDEEFSFALNPVDKAKEVVSKWKELGHSIHFISARPKTTRRITLNWLKKHKFWFDDSTLDLIDPGEKNFEVYKKNAAKDRFLDIMIEDSISIANSIGTKVLLLDYPWNQGLLNSNVTRVNDWMEVENIVDNMF
jgi:uncharacterized protein